MTIDRRRCYESLVPIKYKYFVQRLPTLLEKVMVHRRESS